MTLNQLLPFVSTVIMAVFAFEIFRRYLRRRAAYLLLWGIGITMFGIASFAEAYSAIAWNPAVFRAWYLFGALLVAAWLGQGTAYLLARRPYAHASMAALAALSLVAAWGTLTLSLNPAAFSTGVGLGEQYKHILSEGAWVRGLTPIFNIYGTIALVGGAIYSAWLFWRKKVLASRMWGNVLIALGVLVVASASTLTRFGIEQYLYLGELVAATLMFAGFLVASRRQPERQTQHAAESQPASG